MNYSIVLATGVAVGSPLVTAAELTVDARAKIYGAGHVSPFDTPQPSGGGGGVPPPGYAFSVAGPTILRFTAVTGYIDVNFAGPAGPDGHGPATGDRGLVVGAWNGLSEYAASRYACLVGVFLSDQEPLDPAPPPLDYSVSTLDFTELAPGLNQVFYVGDGRDGLGNLQKFWVPPLASRLFLGIPDHVGGTEPAGWYNDNTGAVNAQFEIIAVPEPADLALAFGMGLLAWAFWSRRTTP